MTEILIVFTLLAPTFVGAAVAKATHKFMSKYGKKNK